MLVAILAAVASCSAGLPPPPTLTDFFPLGEGAAWTWRVTLEEVDYEERWIAREVETDGPGQGRTFRVGWLQRFPSGGENEFAPWFDDLDHYIVSANGSRVAHHRWATDLTAHPVPGWRLDLEEDEASWLLRADAKPGEPIKTRRKHSRGTVDRVVYTLLARDATVTVPAGTFEDCLHIRIEEWTSRDTAGPFAGHQVVEWWFAPHVGPVKRKTDRGADDEPPRDRTERVLLDYRLPAEKRAD